MRAAGWMVGEVDMKKRIWTLTLAMLALLAPATGLWAQLAPPNAAGVAMGHLHYNVRDIEANRDFWVRLGGEPAGTLGAATIVKFTDVLVLLSEGASSGTTEGSVIDHVAFRVESLDEVAAAGFEVERLEGFVGVASVFTPEGERIELFDETAQNLMFTIDGGGSDPVAERHNRAIGAPIISHHIHLYLPEGAVSEAKDWYARMFGGTRGMRWRYDSVDLPGINFNFSSTPETLAPTRGRMLDHIGLEIQGLEEFCRRLEDAGVEFDEPYRRLPSGIATARLTDPWGAAIELTEGLNGI